MSDAVPSALARATRDLREALRPLDGSYVLIGGLAVVLRGFPRHTDDIDIVVLGPATSPAQLVGLLGNHGFEPRVDDAVGFASQSQVLLMRHAPTGIELDVSLGWLPFEAEAVAGAEAMEIEGVALQVARVEDLLIYKGVAWRERDRRDILELVGLHGRRLDLGRVQRFIAQFADAIEEPERAREFAVLVASATPKS